EAQAAVLAKAKGKDGILAFLQRCLGCHNCRTVCPVCYCKECFFDSPTFEIEASKFLGWAEARGALRLPADTLLFHLTRANHMAHSCVACGMCTQACPSGIEVGALFSALGRRVQALFQYEPGKSLGDEIPLSTFREDELQVFGGR
ncbi:MAG: 4Fe-4S dicluster domain-containing protein, partial [Planctomycetes bacterium]|nr:4Fe-4S dicluster domain-containing protein [Planctomycetota bacterium]